MADLVPYDPRSALTTPRDPFAGRVPEGYPEPPAEAMGVKDYLAIARRQWWIVLSIVAVVVGVTGYVVFTTPPQYRATSVIRLQDSRRAMTGGGAGEAGAYEQVMGRETDVLLSQIQVMMSRQVAGDVVDKEGLRLQPTKREYYLPEIANVQVSDSTKADSVHVNFGPSEVNMSAGGQRAVGTYGSPIEAGGITLTVRAQPRVLFATFRVLSKSKASATLLDAIKAAPRPKTDIIDLQVVASEPHFAQRVANAMAQIFQQHNTESAQQMSRRRRIFLEEQMKQTDAMLQRAMAASSGYRTGQQVFSSKEKASAQQAGIVNVDIRRADLDAQRRTFKNLLAQAQKSNSDGLRALVSAPGIAANPVIQQLYGQLTMYETQRDSMVSSGNAATHPDLVAVNGLIAQNTSRLMAAVRSQISALDAQIDALDNLKQTSTAAIASAPQTETEEARLAQQVEAVQKISDNLQEDYQKAKMAEAVEAGQVEVVDLADLPDLPVAAGRIRKLALGVVIGLLLGFGAAVLVDGMNTSIRRRDDLEKVLQVPGLAVIPKFMPSSGGGRLSRALPGNKSRNGNGKKSHRADGLVTIHDARSSGAEAYRTLRTNLIFSQAVQSLRTLVVTSPAPGEGKTTTAANLAVSFAQQGMRVLIVDCDLRRSRLHKMFSVPREPGVTELVLGLMEQDAVVRETSVPGLYVLPSGQLPPNPAELLGGDRMKQTLAKLGEAYDLIILDTPPLLAASDAAILSTIADGVVIVVRAGVTESEAGQQAMQQLASVGARVVGAVLNDPDSKLQQYGGYYSYEYAGEA